MEMKSEEENMNLHFKPRFLHSIRTEHEVVLAALVPILATR